MTITAKIRWDENNFRETAEHFLESNPRVAADPEGELVDAEFQKFHSAALDAVRRQITYCIAPVNTVTGRIQAPLPEYFHRGYWVHSVPRYDFERSTELRASEREEGGFSEVTALEFDHPADFVLEVDVHFFLRIGQVASPMVVV